jgi:hypothetical protein
VFQKTHWLVGFLCFSLLSFLWSIIGRGDTKINHSDFYTVTRNGWVGYRLYNGEAGYGYLAFAVPYANRGVMLEIGFVIDPSLKTNPAETILSTLKLNS